MYFVRFFRFYFGFFSIKGTHDVMKWAELMSPLSSLPILFSFLHVSMFPLQGLFFLFFASPLPMHFYCYLISCCLDS